MSCQVEQLEATCAVTTPSQCKHTYTHKKGASDFLPLTFTNILLLICVSTLKFIDYNVAMTFILIIIIIIIIYHNWSATKQRPHPQSVAEISRHSVLSGDKIRQCETSSGSRHKDTDQCL